MLLISGCDASPAPAFFGATRTEVTVAGRQFAVFQKDDSAEVVRLGWASKSERDGMTDLMVRAAEQATGCQVKPTSVDGDSGQIRVRLNCPG